MASQQKPVKKIPERRCIGCAGHFPKKDLIRVVRTPEGQIILDATGKAAGRGAYLCKNAACLAKAQKAHRLEAAFSCRIDEAVYLSLSEGLMHGEE